MLGWLLRRLPDPHVGHHLLRDEGEVVVDEVGHHWVAYLRPAGWGLLALALLVWLPFADADIGWLVLLVALGVGAYAAVRALVIRMDRFVITNMRVLRLSGLVSRSQATMPLSRILDISVRKPLPGRILGYGHFVFESAAQAHGRPRHQLRVAARRARPHDPAGGAARRAPKPRLSNRA